MSNALDVHRSAETRPAPVYPGSEGSEQKNLLQRRRADLQVQDVQLQVWSSFLTCASAFIMGNAAVFYTIPFVVSTDIAQFAVLMAAAAAPFTFAGFLAVAASTIEQRRQLAILQTQHTQQELDSLQELSEKVYLDYERLFLIHLERYRQLLESIDVVPSGSRPFNLDTRGRAGFSVLYERLKQRRKEEEDERRIAAAFAKGVSHKLAPFVAQIGEMMQISERLPVERRALLRGTLRAMLSDEEVEVLDVVIAYDRNWFNAMTLKSWLAQDA
jgi:hypothetical protein